MSQSPSNRATRGLGALATAAMILVFATACGSDDEEAAADASVAPAIDAAGADTWTTFAAGFIETYCFACHGPGDNLRDYSLLPTVQSEMVKIRCGVSAVTLADCAGQPPARQFPVGSGAKPSDADRLRLVEWIDNGAPN